MTTQFDEQVSNTYGNQEPDADARLMATLIYVLSFFTSLIAPLIIWLIKRDESPFVDRAGKNYLNFLLSYLIWITVASIAIFIIIGIIILPILLLLNFIFTIVAAVKAYNGEDYLPPLSIRFFK
ncbi:DUF4870 domain-containing protein [Staphylococcus xylosus]|uniref:DUF4870 domain-containing protein n=2 Tax=Staphylococcus xylosus TaxID=1288 RepID=A0A5R9B2K1_STAXY|nr:DUF4870 domain-containing protein [Staphylococcus xylosus]MBE6178953.1 DUF4870 domain-containing protein [Staphylococcus xylosus]MBG3874409.1 DUF4870 domain-containing protein [Staphylococcus xylosus]MBM6638400.1 DUF4870 domain-containing protein [Staphylococcus xylosus]MCA2499654.1 DUF4870 domain-containing protein [Staphylococcus xylosus]MCA2503008.1 DUF4870 domain-containing protein [Staphylococcus xylosus]